MELLVALVAVIGSLVVIVVERHWSDRSDRRQWEADQRRAAYARYYAAVMNVDYRRDEARESVGTDETPLRLREFRGAISEQSVAYAEVLLLATPEVVRPAWKVNQAAHQLSEQSLGKALGEYLKAVRSSLGLPPVPDEVTEVAPAVQRQP